MTDEGQLGPIDYLVVEFPGSKSTGEGMPLLVDLVDRGTIRILDLVFVQRSLDGDISEVKVSDLPGGGEFDLSVFEGVSSGLLDMDDFIEAAAVIEPGSSAGIMVYENTWCVPFVAALRRGGGQLVASGRIPTEALLSAMEAHSGS